MEGIGNRDFQHYHWNFFIIFGTLSVHLERYFSQESPYFNLFFAFFKYFILLIHQSNPKKVNFQNLDLEIIWKEAC